MKEFDNFNDAFMWIEKTVKNAKEEYIPIVTEQIYKDSDKYTYRDSGHMYDTGDLFSNFKQGEIILRTPYVKKLYYLGGKGVKNSMARPQWIEITAKENMSRYTKMYSKVLNDNK